MFPFVPQSELADLLASADVHFVTLEAGMEGLCVPSKFYTCLASGRPILALVPEECEVAYVVQEAACGVRVEPGDAKMLANSLVALAAEPEAIEEMGCRARRIFEDRFTTTKTAQRLYETICRSTGRR
jgi:glycosyltransferase involved in cell wall biosynthesis